jgi:prepilin-type N-terminal cleavage/methylation domain-containing protein
MGQARMIGRGGGFTLIEILVVIIILGVLAAIVIPQFVNAGEDTEKIAFIADLRIFADAAKRYRLATGQHLEDSSSGELPAGFEPYIQEIRWTQATPIGGVWDTELDSFGVKSALGVHFWGGGTVRDDAYMQMIDAIFDNGDLNTGVFRKLDGDRYYWILKDL